MDRGAWRATVHSIGKESDMTECGRLWIWELDHKEGWAPEIDTLELWCWRRLLRVPWTAKRSNQSIIKEINPEYSLEGLMLKLKLQFFGQLMQRTDLLEKTLMLGKTEGKRRGWQKMRWLDSITNSMDMSLSKLPKIVERSLVWCTIVHQVTMSQTQLSNWTIPGLGNLSVWLWNSSSQPLSVQFSRSVVSDSLQSHEPQHARPPCPSPTLRVYPNSCPLSRWCHLTISSSVIPFSPHLQSFPTSGSFQMSQLFTSGDQNIGVSASTSVLPIHTQDWFPLGCTDWISLQSKGLSRVFSNTTFQKHQFFCTQFCSQSNSHIHTWPLEKP